MRIRFELRMKRATPTFQQIGAIEWPLNPIRLLNGEQAIWSMPFSQLQTPICFFQR